MADPEWLLILVLGIVAAGLATRRWGDWWLDRQRSRRLQARFRNRI